MLKVGAASGAVRNSASGVTDRVAGSSDSISRSDGSTSTTRGNWLGCRNANLGEAFSACNGEDARWRDWNVGFRSCASFVSTRLTTLMPQEEVAQFTAQANRERWAATDKEKDGGGSFAQALGKFEYFVIV